MATKMKAAPNVNIDKDVEAARKSLQPATKRLKKALGKEFDPAQLSTGAAADLLYDLRNLNKLLSAPTAELSETVGAAVKRLEQHFVDTLIADDATGVQGQHSRVQVTKDPVPVVEDWNKFYAHIKKKGEFELLNRAPNRAAIRERWDNKKQVPGVGVFNNKKVSCTKLKGK